jgi:hypothetical protein
MADHPALAREVLEHLYVAEGLSLREVAEHLGPPATKRIVQRALQRHGVPLRPPRPPARKQALLSRALLEYVVENEIDSLRHRLQLTEEDRDFAWSYVRVLAAEVDSTREALRWSKGGESAQCC